MRSHTRLLPMRAREDRQGPETASQAIQLAVSIPWLNQNAQASGKQVGISASGNSTRLTPMSLFHHFAFAE